MAKKRKAVANPARGFATISVPSKAKPPVANLEDAVLSKTDDKIPAVPEPRGGAGEKVEKEYTIPTEEEQEDFELQCLMEKQGPKVRKETQRIVGKAEAEKRTIRKICFPLNHEKIFRFNLTRHSSKQKPGEATEQHVELGEQILRLAREEDAQINQGGASGWRGEPVLVDGWIVQRALIAMGFPVKRVEEGLQALVGRSINPLGKEKGLELAIEETIEWLALNCAEEELPGFVETSGVGNGTRKGVYGPSGEFNFFYYFQLLIFPNIPNEGLPLIFLRRSTSRNTTFLRNVNSSYYIPPRGRYSPSVGQRPPPSPRIKPRGHCYI